jgi:Rod binding domain-containing protein
VSLPPLQNGASALTAPTTPGRRVPVVDRTQVPPEMRAAAEGMEAMFIDYMYKVMRQTVPKSDMDLDSPATEIYRGMMDTENAQKAAHAGGVGLADQIIAYLQSESYNQPKGPPGTESGTQGALQNSGLARTGGTNAGRTIKQ